MSTKAMLVVDESLATALSTAVETMSARSAFTRHDSLPFHLDILHSEVHIEDHKFHSILKAVAQQTPHLVGRCLHWQLAEEKQTLILVVQYDDEPLYTRFRDRLKSRLAGAHVPSTLSKTQAQIVVGSLAGIESSVRDAFLEAVKQAFPITPESTFSCSSIAGPLALPAVPLAGKYEECSSGSATLAKQTKNTPMRTSTKMHVEKKIMKRQKQKGTSSSNASLPTIESLLRQRGGAKQTSGQAPGGSTKPTPSSRNLKWVRQGVPHKHEATSTRKVEIRHK